MKSISMITLVFLVGVAVSPSQQLSLKRNEMAAGEKCRQCFRKPCSLETDCDIAEQCIPDDCQCTHKCIPLCIMCIISPCMFDDACKKDEDCVTNYCRCSKTCVPKQKPVDDSEVEQKKA